MHALTTPLHRPLCVQTEVKRWLQNNHGWLPDEQESKDDEVKDGKEEAVVVDQSGGSSHAASQSSTAHQASPSSPSIAQQPPPATLTTATSTDVAEPHSKLLAVAGDNPLFLSAFVHNATNNPRGDKWSWSTAYARFMDSFVRKSADAHLAQFLKAHKQQKEEVLDVWLKCVAGSVLSQQQQDLCDPRYFYLDERRCGRTVCPYISQRVVAMVESESYSERLWSDEYIASIQSFANNRSVQGFMVERAVLACLQRAHVMRRVVPEYQGDVIKAFSFSSAAPLRMHLDVGTVLYKPDSFNFEAVDAVIRTIQPPVLLPPVPSSTITTRAKKRRKEEQKRKGKGKGKGKKAKGRKKRKLTAGESSSSTEEEEEEDSAEEEQQGQSIIPVYIVAVQITLQQLSADKKRRTQQFFAHSNRWTADLTPDTFRVHFSLVYVMESVPEPGQVEQHTHDDLSYDVRYVQLDQIDKRLLRALATSKSEE